MPKTHPPYPAEFRQQIIELVRAGRTPAELSREFQVTAQTIQNWVGQAARDMGHPLPGKEGLSAAEREELARLPRIPCVPCAVSLVYRPAGSMLGAIDHPRHEP